MRNFYNQLMKRGRRRKRKKKKVSSREILENLGEDWDSEELSTFFDEVDDEYSNWRTVARKIASRTSSQCKALYDLHKDSFEDIMTSEDFAKKHAREIRKLKRDVKKEEEEKKNRNKRRYKFRKESYPITELPYDIPPVDERQQFANRGLPLRMRKMGTHGTKDEDKSFDITKFSRVRNLGPERIPVEDFQGIQRMTKSFVQSLTTDSRKFFVHEWFYPSVDCGYYIRNSFIEILRDYGLSDLSYASRGEWSMIRSMMGKPRRFSTNWLKAEREQLYKYRERVRERHSIQRRKELERQRMTRSRPKRSAARQVNYEEIDDDEEEEKEVMKEKKKKKEEDEEILLTPVSNKMKDGFTQVTPESQITKMKMVDEDEEEKESLNTVQASKILKIEEERQNVIVEDEIDEVFVYPERLKVGDRVAVLHESMYIFRGVIIEARDANYVVEVENAQKEGTGNTNTDETRGSGRRKRRGRPPRKAVQSSTFSRDGYLQVTGVKKQMVFPDICVMKLGPVMCECSQEQYEYLTSFQLSPTRATLVGKEKDLLEDESQEEEEEVEGEGDIVLEDGPNIPSSSSSSSGLSMLREKFLRNSGVLQDPNRAREFVKHPKLRQKMVFSTAEKSSMTTPPKEVQQATPSVTTATTDTTITDNNNNQNKDDVDRELFGGGMKRKERSEEATKEQKRRVEELDKSKMSDENEDQQQQQQLSVQTEEDEKKKEGEEVEENENEEEHPKKKRKIMSEEDEKKDAEQTEQINQQFQQQQQLYLRSSNENIRFQFPPNYIQRDENHPLYNLATLIYHLKKKQRILHQLQEFNNTWIEKQKRLHPFHLPKYQDEDEDEYDDEDDRPSTYRRYGEGSRRSSSGQRRKKKAAPLQQQIMARERDDIRRERFKRKLRSNKSKEGEFLFNYAVQITKLKKVSRIIDDILSNFEHPGTNLVRMRRRSVFALEDEDEQNPSPYIYSPGQRAFPPGSRQDMNLPPGALYPSLAASYQNMVWNQLALSYGMAGGSQNMLKLGPGASGQGGALTPDFRDLAHIQPFLHPNARSSILQDAGKLLKDSETSTYLHRGTLRHKRNESLSTFTSNRRNASRMVAAMKLRLFERIRTLQDKKGGGGIEEEKIEEMGDDELLFDGSNYSFQVRNKRKGASMSDIDLNENITKNEGCGAQINQGVSECVAFLMHLKSCFTNQRARESLVIVESALLALKPKTKDFETRILYDEISELVERIKRRVIPYSGF